MQEKVGVGVSPWLQKCCWNDGVIQSEVVGTNIGQALKVSLERSLCQRKILFTTRTALSYVALQLRLDPLESEARNNRVGYADCTS